MAKQPSPGKVPSSDDRRVSLDGVALEIYVRLVAQTHGRTVEYLARQAFQGAREFIAESERQNKPGTPT
jgi:hypothetical protein